MSKKRFWPRISRDVSLDTVVYTVEFDDVLSRPGLKFLPRLLTFRVQNKVGENVNVSTNRQRYEEKRCV